MIKKENNRYCVYSESGERAFGCYATEEEANARLRQIEYFKHNPDDKYAHINFQPPKGVAQEAEEGLEFRKRAGGKGGLTAAQASEEGIGSGVQRAVNLKNRTNISPDTIKQMVAFFTRHEKNREISPEFKGEPWKDKGYVAWKLWGGDAGKAWAEKVLRQMEAADKNRKSDSNRALSTYRVDYLQPILFVDAPDARQDRLSDSIEAHLTPEGFLRLTGRISGIGVYEYSDGVNTWGELRLPEHVFEQASLDSFKMKPVTDDHPAVFVDSSNINVLQKGNLGSDIRPDESGMYVLADMLITDPVLIDKIKAGKTQLSNGYETLALEEPGTYNGVSYQYIQTAIKGNHTAVVDQARGGELCRLLLDSKGAYSITKDSMPKTNKKDAKLMIGEMEMEVPEEVAMLVEELQKKVAEQGAELAQLKAEKPAEEMPEDGYKMKDQELMVEEPMVEGEEEKQKVEIEIKADSLRATVDSLKAEIATLRREFSAKVDARVKLVTTAKEVDPSIKTDGLTDDAIMAAVVKKVTPALKSKLDGASPEYIKAAFDIAIESNKGRVDSSLDLLTLTHEAAKNDGDSLSDLDALYNKHLTKLKGN